MAFSEHYGVMKVWKWMVVIKISRHIGFAEFTHAFKKYITVAARHYTTFWGYAITHTVLSS